MLHSRPIESTPVYVPDNDGVSAIQTLPAPSAIKWPKDSNSSLESPVSFAFNVMRCLGVRPLTTMLIFSSIKDRMGYTTKSGLSCD